MAVLFDAIGPVSGIEDVVSNPGPPVSGSFLHTCTGTNLILIVGLTVSASPDTSMVGAVAYNGVSMTSAILQHSNNSTGGFVQIFYMLNPPTGTHSVAYSMSGGAGSVRIMCGSISFTGVGQVIGVRNVTSAFGASTTPRLTVASATGNMVVDVECNGSNIPVTIQTARLSRASTNTNQSGNMGQSTAAGAASVTMGYTTTSDSWAMVGLDIMAFGTDTAGFGISGRVLGTTPYRTGNPITSPVSFGTAVTWTPTPKQFGNVDIENLGNQMQQSPTPSQFGNKLPGTTVTVTLSGASAGSVTTDQYGNYSFTGLGAGQYTVTPSRAGWTFVPKSRTFTIANSVNALDFAAQ